MNSNSLVQLFPVSSMYKLTSKTKRAFQKYPQRAIRNITYLLSYPETFSTLPELIWVNPNNIKYMLLPKFYNNYKYPPYVIDGDWDTQLCKNTSIWSVSLDKSNPHTRELIPIKNYVLYQSIKERYKQGIPWEETEHHRRCMDRLEAGDNYVWQGCTTKEEVHQMYSKVDRLYESLKCYGYLTQEELAKKNGPSASPNKVNSEVLVNIGRNGRIIFDEGRHRFLLSRILSIDQIPVRVLVRHKTWQDRREYIAANAQSQELRQDLLSHPDIATIIS